MTIAKEPSFIKPKFKALNVRTWYEGKTKLIRITGHRNIQTLIALSENLKSGITALDMGTWAYRLSGYIHILRHDYNMDIETKFEPHDGGEHGRYFLHTPIEILDIE